MGLNYYATDAKFFLPAKGVERTLARFREWNKEHGRAIDVIDAVTLVDECHRWGFDAVEDETGNIIGLYPSNSSLRDEEHYEDFFALLAPDVREGSFLQYYGADTGDSWGWKFRRNPDTDQVEATPEDVYGVFESDLTPEQRKHYVDNYGESKEG